LASFMVVQVKGATEFGLTNGQDDQRSREWIRRGSRSIFASLPADAVAM